MTFQTATERKCTNLLFHTSCECQSYNIWIASYSSGRNFDNCTLIKHALQCSCRLCQYYVYQSMVYLGHSTLQSYPQPAKIYHHFLRSETSTLRHHTQTTLCKEFHVLSWSLFTAPKMERSKKKHAIAN